MSHAPFNQPICNDRPQTPTRISWPAAMRVWTHVEFYDASRDKDCIFGHPGAGHVRALLYCGSQGRDYHDQGLTLKKQRLGHLRPGKSGRRFFFLQRAWNRSDGLHHLLEPLQDRDPSSDVKAYSNAGRSLASTKTERDRQSQTSCDQKSAWTMWAWSGATTGSPSPARRLQAMPTSLTWTLQDALSAVSLAVSSADRTADGSLIGSGTGLTRS